MSRSDVASIFWFRLLLARVLFSPAYRSRGWWHMYTHTNHTRALTFDLEFERNTVKPRRSPRQFPLRRGRGFSCSFFPPRSLSLFLPLTRVSSSRGQKIFVFFFFLFFLRTNEDPWEPFAGEPWNEHRDLGQRTFNVSDLYILFFENYLAWIAIKQYNRSMYYRLENRVGVYKNRKRFLSIK